MSLFCFLWTPLFYLFWRSLNGDSAPSGGIWALILGSVIALIQFFLGSFIDPGGFGLSRWMSACVDVVALPAILPFIIYFVFVKLRIVPLESDFTGVAFLWLIPIAVFKTLNWSSQNDPILLLGVPVLWTGTVTGIGFFIQIIQHGWRSAMIPAIAGAVVLPLIAATSYWAFFCQYTLAGTALLVISSVPAAASLGIRFAEGRKRKNEIKSADYVDFYRLKSYQQRENRR
jgi:hypothetical protein